MDIHKLFGFEVKTTYQAYCDTEKKKLGKPTTDKSVAERLVKEHKDKSRHEARIISSDPDV
jgi:hypothetical protein